MVFSWWDSLLSMSQYFPVFEDIVDSSLWEEPDFVVKVFLTMLAKKKRGGFVWGTVFNLSRWAKMSEEKAAEALKVLESPDTRRLEPQEFDGRRIEKVEGGWLILNAETYQKKMQEVNARLSNAERQARYRERMAAAPVPEAASSAFKPPTMEEVKLSSAKIGLPSTEAEKFFHYYEANGWRVGKNRMKSVNSALAGWKLRAHENNGRNTPGRIDRNKGTLNEGLGHLYEGGSLGGV
jgi:hypothetical protein